MLAVKGLTENGGDFLLLRERDASEEGKGKGAGADGFCDGQVHVRLEDMVAPGWLLMNGGEIDGCGDFLLGKECL